MLLSMLGLLADAIVRGLSLVAGYVSNSSTFPQPLSEEEEAKCLARLQDGDEEARSILIERNLRLVAHIVNPSCVKPQNAKPPEKPEQQNGRNVFDEIQVKVLRTDREMYILL